MRGPKHLIRALFAVHFNGVAGKFGFPHYNTGRKPYWEKPRTIQTNLFGGNVVQFTPKRSLHCFLHHTEVNHVVFFKKAGTK